MVFGPESLNIHTWTLWVRDTFRDAGSDDDARSNSGQVTKHSQQLVPNPAPSKPLNETDVIRSSRAVCLIHRHHDIIQTNCEEQGYLGPPNLLEVGAMAFGELGHYWSYCGRHCMSYRQYSDSIVMGSARVLWQDPCVIYAY